MLSYPGHYEIDKMALYFKRSILPVLNENFNSYIGEEPWIGGVEKTQTSNIPKVWTNQNFARTQTSINPKVRTSPNFEQTQKFLAWGGLRIIRPPASSTPPPPPPMTPPHHCNYRWLDVAEYGKLHDTHYSLHDIRFWTLLLFIKYALFWGKPHNR